MKMSTVFSAEGIIWSQIFGSSKVHVESRCFMFTLALVLLAQGEQDFVRYKLPILDLKSLLHTIPPGKDPLILRLGQSGKYFARRLANCHDDWPNDEFSASILERLRISGVFRCTSGANWACGKV